MKLVLRILAVLLVLQCNVARSQCTFEGNVPILDLDTTTVSLLITDAVEDDLSTFTQGVCAVNVRMRHTFIGDLFVELVSPAGQRVRLMGPAVNISSNTSFVTWDVQFNACAFPVFPDGGYEPIWDNLQTWLGGTTYVGTYYPFEGCLEDFDMGTVNGEWKLEFIDQSQFGVGEALAFELFFCNTDGVTCNLCDAGDHSLGGSSLSYCQFDPALVLDLPPVFAGGDPDPDLYNYGYAILDGADIVELAPSVDLTDYAGGDYTICGISYQGIDSVDLFSVNTPVVAETLATIAEEQDICLTLSSDCVSLSILDAPPLVVVEEQICAGDNIVIDGTAYSESGTYTIINQSNGCDSISRLVLDVLENPYPVVAMVDTLSCQVPTTTISADGLPVEQPILWTTTDGRIAGPDSTGTIEVELPGTYTANITVGQCVYAESVTIVGGADYIDVQIPIEIVTCSRPSVVLAPAVTGSQVDSVLWQSAEPFTQTGTDITVMSGGTYTATIYTPICVATRVVNVSEDTAIPDFIIQEDTISCTNADAVLAVSPTVDLDYDYAWYQNSVLINNDSVLTVTSGGIYEQIVTTPNGCMDTFEIDVVEYNGLESFSLNTQSLTCLQPTTVLSFTSSIPVDEILSIVWTDPTLATNEADTLLIDAPGTYMLSIEAAGECNLDTTFEITADFESRDILIADAAFDCNVDSIQLDLQGTLPGDTIRWTGPTSSVVEDPWIQQAGTYTVSVTPANGCTVTETIEVVNNTTIPLITLDYIQLNCAADSFMLFTDEIGVYQYDWTLADGVTVVSGDTIIVYEAGTYRVRVTDAVNDCSITVPVFVEESITDTLSSIVASPISCIESTSQVTIQTASEIDSFQWADADGLPLALPVEPEFSDVGEYILFYELANGCSGIDTIEVVALQQVPTIEVTDGLIDCIALTATSVATIGNASEYTVTWTAPDNEEIIGDSIEVSLPGIYQAVVTAAGECRDTAFATIVDDTAVPEVGIASEGNISCTASSVLVYGVGISANADLLWNGPDVQILSPDTLLVSTPGLYTLTATGQNGCSAVVGIQLESEVVFPTYTLTGSLITCDMPEGIISILPEEEDYTIVWEDASLTTFSESVTEPGVYAFTISNPEGCSTIDSIEVLRDTLSPAPQISVSNPLNCTFDEAVLDIANVNTMETYTWSGPGINDVESASVTITEGGLYRLITTAETGCSDTTTLDIELNLTIPDLQIEGNDITCEAGKSILAVTSEIDLATVTWTGPNDYNEQTAETLVFEEGTYYLDVVGTNGCIASDSVEIQDLRVFPEIEIDDYYLRCDGSELSIQPTFLTTDVVVRWFGPNDFFLESPTLSTTVVGEYYGVAINEEGCATQDTFNIIDEVILPEFESMGDLLNCYRPAQLIATNTADDSTVVWIDPAGTTLMGAEVLVEEPGVYDLIVMGTNACADTVEVTVVDGRSTPMASVEQVSPFQCLTESILLDGMGVDAIGNITYQWSTADGMIVSSDVSADIEVVGEGTYELVVLDEFTGCTDTAAIVLIQDEQSFSTFFFDINPPSCQDFANASIAFTEFVGGFSPYLVEVDGNAYGPSTEVLYLHAGEHVVVVTDSIGCEVEQLIVIPEGDYPSVTLPADTIISLGDSVLVDAVVSPSGADLLVEWNIDPPCTNCTSFWVQPFADLYYEITVSDAAGCSSTADMLISVNDQDVRRLPNIFSPNGDGLNDRFYMPFTKGIDNIAYLRIYDWNGALVYSANDIEAGDESAGWDGTHRQQPALEGVYIYQVGLQLITGETLPLVGDVTLLR